MAVAFHAVRRAWFQRRSFQVGGVVYNYFYHSYNVTWVHERAVEIPIAREEVLKAPVRRTLEVGHVLGHYLTHAHDVVDKYEVDFGVINEDIVDYKPAKPYDLIVSVSTLEHVGWDEPNRRPDKVSQAVEHLVSMLAPGGRLLMTFPIGHNSFLDDLVRRQALPFTTVHYLKRLNQRNDWAEVSHDEAVSAVYGRPYPAANAIVVASFDAPRA